MKSLRLHIVIPVVAAVALAMAGVIPAFPGLFDKDKEAPAEGTLDLSKSEPKPQAGPAQGSTPPIPPQAAAGNLAPPPPASAAPALSANLSAALQADAAAGSNPGDSTLQPSAEESISAPEQESTTEVEKDIPAASTDAEAAAKAAAAKLAAKTGEAKEGTPDSQKASSTTRIDSLQRSNLVLAKLLENDRAVDPFGLVMDPANAKATPVLADQYAEVEDAPVMTTSSLKDALLTIPITGVYPARDLIVIGARSFEVGGQFGMKLQELTIRLRFEGVRDGEIFFKDMETREVTSIPFNPRPSEFEPITKGSKREPGAGILAMDDLFIVN